MFSKDDIHSYTTNQAVADVVLIKADSKLSSEATIKLPVYFTDTVWNRYVTIPDVFKDIQNENGRLWDILIMFAFQAKKCSGSVLQFKFTCQQVTLPAQAPVVFVFQIKDGNLTGKQIPECRCCWAINLRLPNQEFHKEGR